MDPDDRLLSKEILTAVAGLPTQGGLVRAGKASRPGLAWLGLAWLGLAWLGLAWLGLAWLGPAWPNLAWPGLAGLDE